MKSLITRLLSSRVALSLILLLFNWNTADAQTTAFAFQGRLIDSGSAANGSYDIEFRLLDAPTAGTQVGSTLSSSSVSVSGGTFLVVLDFGAPAFPGANRWIEIRVRAAGGGGFTTLTPRQAITATPYAVQSLNAATATSAASLNCATPCVSTAAIVNGAVTAAKVAADVATQAELDVESATRAAADTNLLAATGARVSKTGDTMSGTLTLPADSLMVGGAQLVAIAGRVGVGTTSPSEKLEVAGNVKAVAFIGDVSGNSTLNGFITVAGLLDRLGLLEKQLACAAGCHLWSKRFGGAGQDYGSRSAVDPSGNIVVTGSFENSVDFGGGALGSTGTFTMFLAKFSGIDGSHIWSRAFGSSGTFRDGIVATVDGNGDVVVTGYFFGTVNFGGGNLTSTGPANIFVAKFSGADGSHLWSKRFGGTGFSQGSALSVNTSGNVLVTGSFESTVDFGGGVLSSLGGSNIFLAMLNGADGSALWSKRLGNALGEDYGRGVAVDRNGDILVTGLFQGTLDFGGGGLTSAGDRDIFVAKFFGADGSHLWSKRFGSLDFDQGNGVTVDNESNIVVTGQFKGSVDFGGGALTSAGGFDIFVAKLSGTSGAHLWSKRFGGSSDNDNVAPAVIDTDGNVVVTGNFSGTTDFGGGAVTSAGVQDIFVARYSGTTGAHAWSKRFGGSNVSDSGAGVSVDGSGNTIVTGQFQGAVDFGAGSIVGAGGADIFLLKLH